MPKLRNSKHFDIIGDLDIVNCDFFGIWCLQFVVYGRCLSNSTGFSELR